MLQRISSRLLSAFLIILLLLVATTKSAHAYIDVATGGYLIQMLVMVIVSSLLAIKIFWNRIFSNASRLFSKIKRSDSKIE